MCAMVSGLVSGRTLHDFARGLHLQRCLALDVAAQWEAKHLSGWADGMLADSFEALLAALFMDRGFNAAKSLIMRLIEVNIPPAAEPHVEAPLGLLGVGTSCDPNYLYPGAAALHTEMHTYPVEYSNSSQASIVLWNPALVGPGHYAGLCKLELVIEKVLKSGGHRCGLW